MIKNPIHSFQVHLTLMLTLTLLLILTLTSPIKVSADSSKEFKVYNSIKLNMTLTEAAKIIYGKKYKSYLKKEYGVTTLKRKERFKEKEPHKVTYVHDFYGTYDKKDDMTYYKMDVFFQTKKDGKTLYVVSKSFDNQEYSGRTLKKNVKFKRGMTYSQVDDRVQGKGLGTWTVHYQYDYSKVGEIYGDKVIFTPKTSYLYYDIHTYNKKNFVRFIFEYDYKKSKYFLTEFF